VVTIDKDFGELAVLRGFPHCGIVRLVNFRAAQQGRVCLEILANFAVELSQRAVTTAEPGRIRIRQRGE
jgi:predicted nuclease of predicted toxin-antitoxin system